jgi:hypothetical protein
MLEITDYSNRRGALVPMFPKIHALFAENATKDTLARFTPPENIILWKQRYRKLLLEINRRFLLVIDGYAITGLMFYHFKDGAVYLDELQIGWYYRNNPAVFNLLIEKFVNSNEVKAVSMVYAGANIKSPADKELLASVGFTEKFPEGFEPLGSVSEAAGALKLRYIRT